MVLRIGEGPPATDRHEARVADFREDQTLTHSALSRVTAYGPSPTAIFTNEAILASYAGVSFARAKYVGQTLPLSIFALSVNSRGSFLSLLTKARGDRTRICGPWSPRLVLFSGNCAELRLEWFRREMVGNSAAPRKLESAGISWHRCLCHR